ncbi:DUF58 domain-containing protein [Microlunatus sp. GCM10028923]|uniref:DUF58 domain-containing protein n=1 Tax=Microlunatus sp. GCM10028923 TaxID=3273400 RepID=UPI003609D62E
MTVLSRDDPPARERARPEQTLPPRLSLAAGLSLPVAVGLIMFALLAGRPDVVTFALPVVLFVLWGWLGRPAAPGRLDLRADDQQPAPGVIPARMIMEPAGELIMVRVNAPGHRPREAVLDATRLEDRDHGVGISMETVRTGRRDLFWVEWYEAGTAGVTRTEPQQTGPVAITVLPGLQRLSLVPLPFRLQGLTGPHSWRRAGDGGELHDVRPFAPGDRLRRIDWRVTARRAADRTGGQGMSQLAELYVRRTYATADACVMLVLDSRDEIGPVVSSWGDATEVREDQATSLDIARVAALSIADRYLGGGDRVGLEDLGRMQRPVRPAGGQHQARRLALHLALAAPLGEPGRRERVPRLPSGSMIVLCSTFLDDDVARIAIDWHRTGHRVVAVDVLPRPVTRDLSDRGRTAYRMIMLERVLRFRGLARTGIELIRWDPRPAGAELGGESVPADAALTAMSRLRRRR